MDYIPHGDTYWFGLGCDTQMLPAGFTFKESRDDFVMATGPSGQEYFIKGHELIPRKTATVAKGGLKVGDSYADIDNPVAIHLRWVTKRQLMNIQYEYKMQAGARKKGQKA